jgi:hypothetical protein
VPILLSGRDARGRGKISKKKEHQKLWRKKAMEKVLKRNNFSTNNSKKYCEED